ncbi:MAG: DUF2284 domain-containing protein [Promethearchaeota archaeon]
MPFLEIKLGDIFFDPKVQTYCLNPDFKCPNYGHSWVCPPEAPYLEETISKYQKFYLLYVKSNLKEYVQKKKAKYPKRSEKRIRNEFFMKNLLCNKFEKEIFSFIKNFQPLFKDKLLLWDGFCRVCFNKDDKGCTYDSGKPCRYPDKKRYSMEAVGIDVTKTVTKLNFNLEWPPKDNIYRFGLICLK